MWQFTFPYRSHVNVLQLLGRENFNHGGGQWRQRKYFYFYFASATELEQKFQSSAFSVSPPVLRHL